MSEIDQSFLANVEKIVRQLDDVSKAQYLAYGEGMLAAKQMQNTGKGA